MSQFDYTIGSGKTGAQYRSDDNSGRGALASSNKGSSAPSYAVAGMLWLDDSGGAGAWVIKVYDGTDWISIGNFNTTTNIYTPANAALVDGSRSYAADAGSTDAYAISNSNIGTLAVGQVIQFKANTISTGPATLSVNSGSAIPIKKKGTVALDDGDIQAGQIVSVVYDGTNFQLLSAPLSSTPSAYYAADSVGTDAYAVALTPAWTSYQIGIPVQFKAGTINTGPATLNVNSLGAKNIYKPYNTVLESGDIKAGQIVSVVYDGTNFQLLSPISTFRVPPYFIQGPPPLYNSASVLTLPTGMFVKENTAVHDIYVLSNIDIDLTLSGIGGLDTGSETSSTWYYPYLLRNSTTGAVGAVLSATNEWATGAITRPSGYDEKRQLPFAIRNDASGNIIPFTVIEWGNRVICKYDVAPTYFDSSFNIGPTNVVNAGSATSFTSISAANFVPPFAFRALLSGATSTSGRGQVQPTGGSLVASFGAGSTGLEGFLFETKLNSSRQFDYKRQSGASPNLYIDVMGWVVTERVV